MDRGSSPAVGQPGCRVSNEGQLFHSSCWRRFQAAPLEAPPYADADPPPPIGRRGCPSRPHVRPGGRPNVPFGSQREREREKKKLGGVFLPPRPPTKLPQSRSLLQWRWTRRGGDAAAAAVSRRRATVRRVRKRGEEKWRREWRRRWSSSSPSTTSRCS